MGKYIHLALRDSQALLGQTRSRPVVRSKCFDLVADRLQVHAVAGVWSGKLDREADTPPSHHSGTSSACTD
jgi:hypothetical protein